MSQLFPSGDQSGGTSVSALVLPMNIQGWFPWGLIVRISLQSKGLSRVFSNNTVQKHQFFSIQVSLYSNSHIHASLLEKPYLWLYRPFLAKYCLLFNMLSRFVIAFLPRSKYLLISWLQSPSAVILEPKKRKSIAVSIVSPSICHEVMGQDAMILVFWMLSFKPAFSLSSFTVIKRLSSSSLIFPIRVISYAYLRSLISLLAILIPACVSSNLAFPMMYSAYRLNKRIDNIQPWHTPFPLWNQSVVTCQVLTVASWPAYRFLRRHVRWSRISISWRIFHSLCDPHSQRLWCSQ